MFTEFLHMVEDQFGLELLDRVLLRTPQASGVYTAVGTYDPREMNALVTSLGAELSRPVAELLRAFGRHLFQRFVVLYPHLLRGATDALALLEQVEGHIHVEVRKLYPDAQLPRFRAFRSGAGRLELVYESPRRLADFAHGLMEGCLQHFRMDATIVPYAEDAGDGAQRVRFLVTCPSAIAT